MNSDPAEADGSLIPTCPALSPLNLGLSQGACQQVYLVLHVRHSDGCHWIRKPDLLLLSVQHVSFERLLATRPAACGGQSGGEAGVGPALP